MMKCQEIKTGLSSYIDGEVRQEEAEIIKAHLAKCASCLREFEQLRSANNMMRAIPEIEPPAFLMEQIRLATVERPTAWHRFREAAQQMLRIPRFVQWAAVACALAVLLIYKAGMLEQGARQHVTAPPAKTVAAQAQEDKAAPVVNITESDAQQSPVVVLQPKKNTNIPMKSTRKHRIARKRSNSRPAAVILATEKAPLKPAKVTPEEPVPVMEQAQSADTNEKLPEEVAVVAVQSEQPSNEAPLVKVAVGNRKIEADNTSALEAMKAELAKRNRQRRLEGHASRDFGGRNSFDIATIRF